MSSLTKIFHIIGVREFKKQKTMQKRLCLSSSASGFNTYLTQVEYQVGVGGLLGQRYFKSCARELRKEKKRCKKKVSS